MIAPVHLWLRDAENTRFSGKSLAHTLYGSQADILLTGNLGTGKTTFLQAFFQELGIAESVTSPTYALEQRYKTSKGQEVLHIDLYRLTEEQARDLIRSTDHHEGIRCIEWADRLPMLLDHPSIHLAFAEEKDGRSLDVSFTDIPLPSSDTIEEWLEDVMLPVHIREHCHAVSALCVRLAEYMITRGTIVRTEALARAGHVHDLLRFVDFHRGGATQNHQNGPEAVARWEVIAQQFPSLRHEAACAKWLRDRGFDAIATIVEPHGLFRPSPERVTIEQKILFYADKRMAIDQLVSVEERFADFARRYGEGKETEESKIWYAEATALERALFPDGPPF